MQIRLQQPLEALQCRIFLHFADATRFEEAAGDSLNQAKEQIETIQREIDETKEQENSSLWQESPH
jgi:hypothetical protein